MQADLAFMVQRMEAANKTEEIMARFRPIAPKPTLTLAPPPLPPVATLGSATSNSVAHKRGREEDYYILPPYHLRPPVWWHAGVGTAVWRRRGSSMPNLRLLQTAKDDPLVRLSLAVSGDASSSAPPPDAPMRVFPFGQDLPSKIKVPKVITPRPLRPLRTTICIDTSNIVEDKSVTLIESNKTAKEVEVEVEQDARPTVVCDCNNRVLLVNDAYKAMVGQPVCLWLDDLPGTSTSKRINGEVVLKIQTFCPATRLPNTRGASPCTARISWERDGAMASLTVSCAVERLTGNSGNYCSIWRFNYPRASIVYCLM